MNKKTISLAFLLILLVSVTISYAIVTQQTPENNIPSDNTGNVDDNTLASEIDASLLDENQEIEIGEMI